MINHTLFLFDSLLNSYYINSNLAIFAQLPAWHSFLIIYLEPNQTIMSQQHDKNKTPSKEDQHKKKEDTLKHIENTGKKVNEERSKNNTDKEVKNKVTGANQEAPPY
jgi:hypothetical protein